MQSQESRTESDIVRIVDGFIATRRISCKQYQKLSDAILADNQVDEDELRQINRLWEAVRNGRVTIVD